MSLKETKGFFFDEKIFLSERNKYRSNKMEQDPESRDDGTELPNETQGVCS